MTKHYPKEFKKESGPLRIGVTTIDPSPDVFIVRSECVFVKKNNPDWRNSGEKISPPFTKNRKPRQFSGA